MIGLFGTGDKVALVVILGIVLVVGGAPRGLAGGAQTAVTDAS